jgi:hypothetical protein
MSRSDAGLLRLMGIDARERLRPGLRIAPEHNAVVAVRGGEERRHGGLRLEVTSRQLTVTLSAHSCQIKQSAALPWPKLELSCSSKEPTPKQVHRRARCESRSASCIARFVESGVVHESPFE